MWTLLKRWWVTEGAVVHLSELDDRLLADMGLEREGLRERVRGDADASVVTKVGRSAVVCAEC
jgi:uncharacterized protein YjiS (DUF1127 family)